jgi:ATP/maltotriose-dependent transcriptional regulator MalT
MVEWLAQPFDLLAGGAADLPERHRSARDAIAWSYDLLGPAEQTLLRALSVFVGGATLEAIAAVALDPRGEPHVGASVLLDQLALLIDHSLLTQEPQEDGRPRYLLPLLVREYAAEQARAAGERFRLQRAHACHYLALAQEAAWGLEGPAQARWLRRLDLDHENLRTAIRWAVDEGEPSIGLQLLSAARHFLWLHGDLGEARRWLDGLLARPGAAPEPVRARALLTAGQFAFYQGDFARAAEQLEDAARTAAGVADHQTRILAHLVLCRVALAQGDAETARLWIEEGHALARATGDATLLCESLNYLGLVLDQDPDVARSYFEHNLSFFSRHGDEWGTGPALRGLGLIAWTQGNLALAGRLLADGVSLYRQKGSRHGLSVLLHDLGQVLLTRGDTTGAAGAFGESMTTARRLGNPALCALALAGLACVAVSGGRTRRAVRWFGASAEARDRYGAALEEVGRATYREFVGRTRRALGESEFLTLWTEGRSLPLERAADEALAEACPAPEQAAAAVLDAGRRYGLTRRELEVVALLGQGRSNREIGAALVITEGTANLHVRHILAKLGVASRAQAAVWAVQQGLIASAAAVVESRAGLAAVRRAT